MNLHIHTSWRQSVLRSAVTAIATLLTSATTNADYMVFDKGSRQFVAPGEESSQLDIMTFEGFKAWVALLLQQRDAVAAAAPFQPGTPIHRAAGNFAVDMMTNIDILEDYFERYMKGGKPLPSSWVDFTSSITKDMGDIGTRHMSTDEAKAVLDVWAAASKRIPQELCGKAVAGEANEDEYLSYLSADEAESYYGAKAAGVNRYLRGEKPRLPPPQEVWAKIHANAMKNMAPADQARARRVMSTASAAYDDRCWYAQRLIATIPLLEPSYKDAAISGLAGYLIQQ